MHSDAAANNYISIILLQNRYVLAEEFHLRIKEVDYLNQRSAKGPKKL